MPRGTLFLATHATSILSYTIKYEIMGFGLNLFKAQSSKGPSLIQLHELSCISKNPCIFGLGLQPITSPFHGTGSWPTSSLLFDVGSPPMLSLHHGMGLTPYKIQRKHSHLQRSKAQSNLLLFAISSKKKYHLEKVYQFFFLLLKMY